LEGKALPRQLVTGAAVQRPKNLPAIDKRPQFHALTPDGSTAGRMPGAAPSVNRMNERGHAGL